ncbi:E3 ubiquitin-protein ligase PUB23-like [Olea europaea var. sylvestris]|uniref:U-box domain-containing protein n=1 Tax=Olea europaea subsp. europaea TaxID=158383 RepID=A0A8S0VLI2_OLEEU|nr:E3 ubiquitin-protein ligase PUB23-like [Olea europaea var. sylvestris]CAA3032397.1 E3 ubiquitin- ligase PUB23-like [Olea europaea subsp. europaea]
MEKEKNPSMNFPQDFRCPISMELMKDPVTISTGVTYERKSIERWFCTYKKNICPATMQCIESLDMTPNHTLKRLILTWRNARSGDQSCSSSSAGRHSIKHDELMELLGTIESTPFKVSCLKKLKSILEIGDEIKDDFKRLEGVEVLVRIITQVLVESSDFVTFRACEEALGVLQLLLFSEEEDDESVQLLMEPECMKSMGIMLQRGSGEARFYTISIFQKMAKADYHWNYVAQDQGIEFFKSLIEITSDEICTKASSCALQVLIGILDASKKSRLKAIEAGAVSTLIELLPDSNRSKCEKIMQLIKLISECAEGRLAFIEHDLGIAAVCKKLLNVSEAATKIGVKIVWLLCNFHSTESVLEEMLVCGTVKRLVTLLHISGRSTTKDRVVNIFKLHSRRWRRYPCFPEELKGYLGLENEYSC